MAEEGFSIGALPVVLVPVVVSQLENVTDLLNVRQAFSVLQQPAADCIETLYAKENYELPAKAWQIFRNATAVIARRELLYNEDHDEDQFDFVMKLLRSLPSRVTSIVMATGDIVTLSLEESYELSTSLLASELAHNLHTLELDMKFLATDADRILSGLPSLKCLALSAYDDVGNHQRSDDDSSFQIGYVIRWHPVIPDGLTALSLHFHGASGSCNCFDLHLRNVSDVTSLQSLSVHGDIDPSSISLLSSLSLLTSLSITNDSYGVDPLEMWLLLSQLPRLQHAAVPRLRPPAPTAATAVTGLTRLHLLDTEASLSEIVPLLSGSLPQLRKLAFNYDPMFTSMATEFHSLQRALGNHSATSDAGLLRQAQLFVAANELAQALAAAAGARLEQTQLLPRGTSVAERIGRESKGLVAWLAARLLRGQRDAAGVAVGGGEKVAALVGQVLQGLRVRAQLVDQLDELCCEDMASLQVQYGGVAVELVPV